MIQEADPVLDQGQIRFLARSLITAGRISPPRPPPYHKCRNRKGDWEQIW